MNFTPVVTAPENQSPNKPKRHYASASKRTHYVNRWRESNMAQEVFCQRNKLNSKTFSMWVKRYDAERHQSKQSSANEITLTEQPTQAELILEMKLPNGACLKFIGSMTELHISTIIKGVSQCK